MDDKHIPPILKSLSTGPTINEYYLRSITCTITSTLRLYITITNTGLSITITITLKHENSCAKYASNRRRQTHTTNKPAATMAYKIH